VLRFERAKLDIYEPLNTLGFDLMMTEIRNKIEPSFEIPMSIVDLLQGLSVEQLADRVLSKMINAGKFIDSNTPVETIQQIAGQLEEGVVMDLLKQVDNLSDEEVLKLLGSY
jgi:hypothetical protein